MVFSTEKSSAYFNLKHHAKRSDLGFTLIEMLMVILLVAIMSGIAIPQFVDFRKEARNASVNAALGALRTALSSQIGQMLLRCNASPGQIPKADTFNANDITAGLTPPCSAAQVPTPAEKQFTPNALPENPWSKNGTIVGLLPANGVVKCLGTGCNRDGVNACVGAAYAAANTGGWCYDEAKGTVWANSANDGTAAPNGEYSF